MATKKHAGYPNLAGEHRLGDAGQLVLLFVFLVIWIGDSFALKKTIFLLEYVPPFLRIAFAIIIGASGGWLAWAGMKQVFGTQRSRPELISDGVFRFVRHPIYLGAILFYLTMIIITGSLASVAVWIIIIFFYYLISKYEERILRQQFGESYDVYRKRVGMLFPKISRKH